ncbi:MAG: Do family serine endopeptidase [Gemmataceae bacterium]|nr:Do family serine endopeptidase [Gemmataceae bacterium]
MKKLLVLCVMAAGTAGLIQMNLSQGQSSAPKREAIPEPVSYREVVKKVLPAVVSIEVKVKNTRLGDSPKKRPALPDDPRIPEEFRRFYEEFKNREKEEGPSEGVAGFGSGFIVEANGVILTNNHVVEGADKVDVFLHDGRKFTSTDIHGDAKTDLAIVRIKAKGLPTLHLGDSDAMEIGDQVLAFGAPFGLTGSVTRGIISAKGRSLRLNFYEDFLQTDAAINPGNSGGPLINLEGKVIGVNSAIKTRNGGFQGVGMAITSKLAGQVMDQLLKHGVVRRGYLGVQIKDVDDQQVASRLGLKDAKGVIVTQVLDDGPAGKGGLQAGDVIVSLGGKAIKDGKDLQFTVASLPLDKPVEAKILRDGNEVSLKITIVEQPKQFGLAPGIPPRNRPKAGGENDMALTGLGIEVGDLTADLAEKYGYKESAKGVIIVKVDRNSLGFQAGLRAGMIVNKVEKKGVQSASELKALTDKADLDAGILFQVQAPDGSKDYILVKKS